MLWLYLLGIVTVLSIVLRRVLHRQTPLNDALYAKNVAVEHVQSGVAWVRADGTLGSMNQSFAQTFRATPQQLVGQEWYKMFPPAEHNRIREAFSQTLLSGISSLDAPGLRMDGTESWMNVRLVAIHDHNMRFIGHHCLVEDRSRERELEERIRELNTTKISVAIGQKAARAESARSESPAAVAR
jgi:PAS domain S-box-containing protein